jgi:hypothetical protein
VETPVESTVAKTTVEETREEPMIGEDAALVDPPKQVVQQ